MKARRYGIWAGLAIVAAITSGALLAQAPQAIGTWVSVGDVSSPLTNGASVALPDKRTSIAGGALADGTLTDAVTIYDSVDDSATAAGTLTSARADHTATLLKDGRVLVVGGMTADGLMSSDIEIFDPATGTSVIVALLPEPRNGHVAAALPNGNVLIAGGATVDGAILQTAILFDPETSGVSSVPGLLHTARVHASATTMLDGRVLVAGGSNGTAELASAEIYDRYSQSFSIAATQMSVGRQGHSAVLLPDNGGVLVAGGTSNGVVQAGVDLFLPAVFPDPFSYGEGEFTSTGAMTAARTGAVAGPTSIEGFAFAAAGGAPDAEVYHFATIKTDKDDYAPGELATITGSRWQANEEVTLLFQEDPAVHDDYMLKVNADANGNIYWNEWAPEHHDIGVRFYLTATDSRSRAQMTFTDASKLGSVTVGTQAGVLTSGTAGTASYAITVNRGSDNGTSGAFDVTLTVTSALPSGVTASVSPNTVHFAPTDNSKTATINLLTSTATPAGASSFTVRATHSTNASDYVEGAGTLTIGQSTQSPSTATVTCPPSVPYSGSAQTPCTAVATGSGGLNQALTVSYTANINAGTVTASASFPGDATHDSSAGSATFIIDQAAATIDVPAVTVTYDGEAHGAMGTATGVAGEDLTSLLTFGETFTNVPGGTATWNFAGNTNYKSASGPVAIVINQADATIDVPAVTVTYDGQAHGATGTAKGVADEDLTSLLTFGETFTNVPGGTATWNFAGNTNYKSANGPVAIVINQADATIDVPAVTVTYDGQAHGATGTAKGVADEDLTSLLTFGETFTNVPGGTATWNFAGNTNYKSANGPVAIVINQADATIDVPAVTVTYDGQAHGATGTAKGVADEDLTSLLTFGETFTNVPGGTATWNFAGNTNYKSANGPVAIVINQADATIDVPAVTVTYDGQAHGATGTAKGVADEDLTSLLTFGETFTNVPGGTATWNFAGNTNYKSANGPVAIVINQADATIDVPAVTVTYDGQAHGATGTAKGVADEDLTSLLTFGETFTNVPGGTATWNFAGNTNYKSANGPVAIVVNKRMLTITPDGGKTKILGEVFTAFTGQVVGLQGTDTGTATYASLGAAAGATVGSYDITATFNFTNGAGSNYDVQLKTAVKGLVVLYRWDGFLQPINDTAHDLGPMSKFKTGQTIPAKFVLKNVSGAAVQQTGNPTFTRTERLGVCDSATALENPELVSADVAPLYKWDGSQYHYNWSTKGLSAGMYRIFANLADDTAQSVDICLTK